MHQAGIVVTALLCMVQLASALFCSSVLMQSGWVRRKVRSSIKAYLESRIQIVYGVDEPPPANFRYLQA
eukprot:5141571-Alexandrium_andersonii.AAC.1